MPPRCLPAWPRRTSLLVNPWRSASRVADRWLPRRLPRSPRSCSAPQITERLRSVVLLRRPSALGIRSPSDRCVPPSPLFVTIHASSTLNSTTEWMRSGQPLRATAGRFSTPTSRKGSRCGTRGRASPRSRWPSRRHRPHLSSTGRRCRRCAPTARALRASRTRPASPRQEIPISIVYCRSMSPT